MSNMTDLWLSGVFFQALNSVVVLVLVLKESLRTKFKSWSWSLSLRLYSPCPCPGPCHLSPGRGPGPCMKVLGGTVKRLKKICQLFCFEVEQALLLLIFGIILHVV